MNVKFAEDRQQETRLQTYFDRMTELLLEEGLRESEKGDETRSIARTRTLSTLRALNVERKQYLIRFLLILSSFEFAMISCR